MPAQKTDTSAAMHDPPAWQMKQLLEPIRSTKGKSQQRFQTQNPQSRNSSGVPKRTLPTELQFRVLYHVLSDLRQGGDWDRAPAFKALTPFLLVCHAWNQEICKVVSRSCEMLDVVLYAPSDTFVRDVLALFRPATSERKELIRLASLAAERDLLQSLTLLLDAGARPSDEDEEERLMSNALTYNRKGTYLCLKLLIERGDIKPERIRLYRAVDIGDKALIRWLLDIGVDTGGNPSISALCHACNLDRVDIVELLMERGAVVSHQDLLHFCWKANHVSIVFKYDPTAPQRGLAIAAERPDSGYFIKLCLQWGADPNAMPSGWPILSLAARNHLPEVCEMLLNAGADPNPEVEHELLPLYCAAVDGFSPDSARMLVDFGACIPPMAPEKRRVPKFNHKISYDPPIHIDGKMSDEPSSSAQHRVVVSRQNLEDRKQVSEDKKSSVRSAWRKFASRK